MGGPITPAEHFTLDDFAMGSAALTAAHFTAIRRILDALTARPLPPGGVVVLAGNGDAYGSELSNLGMGEARAAAVKTAIVDKAPSIAAQVSTMSLGGLMPLEGTKPVDGRNRRVDVRIDRSTDPKAREGMGVVKRGGGTYAVKPGDTVWRIAERTYGHATYAPRISAANKGKAAASPLDLPEIYVPILDVILVLQSDPAALRDFVVSVPDQDWEALWTGLTSAQKTRHAIVLEGAEIARSSRKTIAELADLQLAFLTGLATAAKKTVGEYLRGNADTLGYGGGTSSEWDKLSPADKKKYKQRFDKVVAALHTTSPAEIQEILRGVEKKGGGIRFMPEEVEKNGAFAYTEGDNTLHAGTRFVDAAEKNLAIVYPNLAHELLGHNVYGSHEYGQAIMDAVLGLLTAAERTKATASGNSLYSVYGYPETECFAEMYEDRYDIPDNPTDRPFFDRTLSSGRVIKADVPDKLKAIHERFDAVTGPAIARGLARRVQIDDFIQPASKTKFRAAVKAEYGFDVP